MFKLRSQSNSQTAETTIYRAMLRREAEAGGKLFGPIPKKGKREFFCLDEHTWVWHEQWQNDAGKMQFRTTRYDIRPSGVLKIQDGHNGYQRLTASEASNLLAAIRLYKTEVAEKLYSHISPQTLNA